MEGEWMLQLIAPPLPSLLDAGEDTYSIGQSHPNRKNIGVFDLLLVTRGSLFMGEGNDMFQVDQESALILYPDRHHYSFLPCDQETHFYWFHFSVTKEWKELSESSMATTFERENIDNRNPFTEKPFGIILPKFGEVLNWKVVDHLSQQIIQTENGSSYSWEWKRQMLFQKLLQEVSSQTNLSKSHPSLAVAEQAAAYLRKNYQKKITYKNLGAELKFHPNHIARCMIHSLGCTPIEYVNRARLDQAKVLLVSKDWSIEKISEECGFSQTAYFSRLFKKKEGTTPNEFRKKFIGN